MAVARLMELVTAARRAIDSGPGAADLAVREAAGVLAVLLSLFAPYTAEECWELLGHEPSVATAGWPAADPALLVTESVTCVVQVNGKVRDRVEVSPDISEDDLREIALAAPGVLRALAATPSGRSSSARPNWSTSSPAEAWAPPPRPAARLEGRGQARPRRDIDPAGACPASARARAPAGAAVPRRA